MVLKNLACTHHIKIVAGRSAIIKIDVMVTSQSSVTSSCCNCVPNRQYHAFDLSLLLFRTKDATYPLLFKGGNTENKNRKSNKACILECDPSNALIILSQFLSCMTCLVNLAVVIQDNQNLPSSKYLLSQLNSILGMFRMQKKYMNFTGNNIVLISLQTKFLCFKLRRWLYTRTKDEPRKCG